MTVFPCEEYDQWQAPDDDQRQDQYDGAEHPVERRYTRAGVYALVATLGTPQTLEHAAQAVVIRFALRKETLHNEI